MTREQRKEIDAALFGARAALTVFRDMLRDAPSVQDPDEPWLSIDDVCNLADVARDSLDDKMIVAMLEARP